MGHYTEVKLKINLRIDTPLTLIVWLNKCIYENEHIPYAPHPFFQNR